MKTYLQQNLQKSQDNPQESTKTGLKPIYLRWFQIFMFSEIIFLLFSKIYEFSLISTVKFIKNI